MTIKFLNNLGELPADCDQSKYVTNLDRYEKLCEMSLKHEFPPGLLVEFCWSQEEYGDPNPTGYPFKLIDFDEYVSECEFNGSNGAPVTSWDYTGIITKQMATNSILQHIAMICGSVCEIDYFMRLKAAGKDIGKNRIKEAEKTLRAMGLGEFFGL